MYAIRSYYEPWLLALSEGLAVRDDDGFWFLCPAAVGLEIPPLSAADREQAWLVGDAVEVLVAADQVLVAPAGEVALALDRQALSYNFV